MKKKKKGIRCIVGIFIHHGQESLLCQKTKLSAEVRPRNRERHWVVVRSIWINASIDISLWLRVRTRNKLEKSLSRDIRTPFRVYVNLGLVQTTLSTTWPPMLLQICRYLSAPLHSVMSTHLFNASSFTGYGYGPIMR